jgi:hypothetical protein
VNRVQSVRNGIKILATAIIICGAVTASAAGTGDGKMATLSYDRYKVLAVRNIYLKNHAPQSVRPILRDGSAAQILLPEQSMVLTGIIHHGSEYVAFFEDRRSGMTTTRVRAGDSLLQGHVARITLDYVEYVKNDKTGKIEIGNNLQDISSEPGSGKAPAAGAGNGAPVITSVTPAQRISTAPADDGKTPEQMRPRRSQELGAQ